MKTPLTLFILAGLLAVAAADAPKRCAICGLPLGPRYYNFSSPGSGGKVAACESCSKLKDRCFICRVPVPAAAAHKLDDGRTFCDRDFRSGVFELNEARGIYEAARRDVAALLAGYGILPEHNITVSLANSAELRKLQLTLPSDHDGEGTLGLTRSESSGRKQFRHQIRLLTGLPGARLAAVCAHEYTHAWLSENLAPGRKLEKDTVEGFCELIAYKLMVQRHDELQRKIILENAYTRGQVNAFIEAENQHNFRHVVKWVQTAADEGHLQANTALTLRDDDEPAGPAWPPPAAVPTRVPDSLMLKGLAGSVPRRFALINDVTLMKNEEGRVRVGSTHVVVRCLDIRAGSVVIQLQGEARPSELFLTHNE